MDFMKLLKSLEELLYELISWFIFYPVTLWRIIRKPLAMFAYAERQLQEDEDRQFDDAVSPPILLLISLIVLHGVGMVWAPAGQHALSGILADDWNLLVFRAVGFSLFPLVFGLIQLKAGKARLSRITFKPIFYSQCYATVPFIVALSLGLLLASYHALSIGMVAFGAAVFLAGLIWYAVVETLWLAQDARMKRGRAAVIVAVTLVCAVPCFFLLVALVGYATGA